MIREIVKIDEKKCDGCGLCITACHEGAIELVEGKARLIRDDYCDGLGNCLPVCPQDAISFERREAADYDQDAVDRHLENLKKKSDTVSHSCPGSQARSFDPAGSCHGGPESGSSRSGDKAAGYEHDEKDPSDESLRLGLPESQLRQWPVQMRLVPANAPYFKGADLLIAADCSAYSYGDFHNCFMKDKVTIIGCPKLDPEDYTGKLTEIIKNNDIRSITVTRMEVPCCAGIVNAVVNALENSGKEETVPLKMFILSVDGKILIEE